MTTIHIFRHSIIAKSLATACLVFPVISAANELKEDMGDVNDVMETIVVTASGFEQAITEAPASISLITREQLENRAYKDLTDALRDVPGVTVTGGGSAQDISIRGMPAEYTAILIDGRKQSGRETQQNSSGGFEQDWLPPLSAIDRIEVVRGPMSTLYGSDAIGGVINIITRKDYKEWHGSVRAEATLQENSDSGDFYQGQVNLAGPLINGLLSTSFSGLYQERIEDEILYGYGGKTLGSYRGSLHLTPTDDDTFSLDFTHHEQQRVTTEGKSKTSDSVRDNNRQSISLSHSGNYDWASGTSYIDNEVVENEGGELEVENLSFNTQWSVPIFDSHYMTIGASYEHQELTDFAEDYVFTNSQWSIFAEDEWYITDDFALTTGLRFDKNDVFDAQLSPRIYGVWSVDTNWTLKGGVSTGYRAPSLTEMEEGWAQESCSGNCSVFGNPDLKPEKSVNSEVGLYYAGDNDFNTSLTVYYSDFQDKIDKLELDTNCGSRGCDSTYVNIEDATTYGAEYSVSKGVSDSIKLSSTYTYTYSEKKSGEDEGKPLTQTPKHLMTVNADWQIKDDLQSWARVTYRGKESEPTTTSSRTQYIAPAITYVDLGATWQIKGNFKLMGGIYNLFDEDTNYDEFGYIEDGRRYWLAAEVSF
ncbi:TonB-dependent receptor domain-containing protein [Shewanella sp. TC10]|uniref:TonB-dependent receptor domain-containing protein n=1 Tax=Shewanella sp. TC10 TaxID=1419739 RepID=UPI00129E287A|nr:TonB-dependent receptor [Shewanella sp. TC10]